MQVRFADLPAHLARTLAPIYLVSGDEPLQRNEASDLIREKARAAGHEERVRMEVDRSFSWETLGQESDNLSLFAHKRILDLHAQSVRLGEAGGGALVRYAERPHPDDVLLLTTPQLDRDAKKTRWYKALEGAAVSVQVWPIERQRLPAWIAERAGRAGLGLTPGAARLLAERVEGNMLACAQEIEKLRLLADSARVDEEAVLAAVADSARFSAFDLVESALLGDAARSARIVSGLEAEGVEVMPVAGALGTEIRRLGKLAADRARGMALGEALARQRVWEKRKRELKAALDRHDAASTRAMLHQLIVVERVSKGAERGAPWDEVLRLALMLCGVTALLDESAARVQS